MSFARMKHGPLDYELVNFEGTPLRFRGPQPDPDAPFMLCLGSSETFGKFVAEPYPATLSELTGLPVMNMGVMNAGLEVMLHDPVVQDMMTRAEGIVLQIMGAQNMTNRFYTVHPRRNDRFLKASAILQTIYRDVDFTEFHFTRHMLNSLLQSSRDRFEIVTDELQAAWLGRMKAVLSRVECPVHLLWMGQQDPAEEATTDDTLGSDPLFVTQAMLDEVAPLAASLTTCVATAAEQVAPTKGMFFAAREEAAARILPGPEMHSRAAQALAQKIAMVGAL